MDFVCACDVRVRLCVCVRMRIRNTRIVINIITEDNVCQPECIDELIVNLCSDKCLNIARKAANQFPNSLDERFKPGFGAIHSPLPHRSAKFADRATHNLE